MESIYYAIAFLCVLILAIAFVAAIAAKHKSKKEEPQEVFGRIGEEKAKKMIQSVMREDDYLFTNVKVEYDGRNTELDNIIVNRYGVFIIEVKNYSGYLIGKENDYEWKKYKKTSAGNVYVKNVKNPIKQVKRQIYILSNKFKIYGIDVWIRGYVMLMNHNPIDSRYFLSCADDIDKAIHSRNGAMLSSETVEAIINLPEITSKQVSKIR